MTRTNTQNRPYNPRGRLMVRATFEWSEDNDDNPNGFDLHKEELVFNWEDRTEVRNFASQSDRIIRLGGKTTLESVL